MVKTINKQVMKRYTVLLIVGCIAFINGCNNSSNNYSKIKNVDGVKLSLKATVSANVQEQEQGEDSIWYWGPPAKRIEFQEDLAKKYAIDVVVGDASFVCPLRYQDVAYLIKEGKRTERVAVSWYEGCPFAIETELDVYSEIEMRVESTIEIEEAIGNVLFLSSKSLLPIIIQNMEIKTGCEMFRNITWLFKKKGIKFSTKTSNYRVTKDGATIKFSSNGIIMDGVEKI